MHILRCMGVVRLPQFPQLPKLPWLPPTAKMHADLFFFEIPTTTGEFTHSTLAEVLLKDPRHMYGTAEQIKIPPLETRIRYAVELCLAVMFTHAAGLVHKSIRPDNIHGGFDSVLKEFPSIDSRTWSYHLSNLSPSKPFFRR